MCEYNVCANVQDKLNKQQKNIVLNSLANNSVVLAGAGTGKTKTIINRTLYLINNKNIDPSSIAMITFTNKAANEIKNRLINADMLTENVFVGTFHNLCTTILRKYGDVKNLDKFVILDTYASKNVLKEAFDKCHIEKDNYEINNYRNRISHCKNNLISSKFVKKQTVKKLGHEDNFSKVYTTYQKLNWKRKTFDFDDLIINTIYLLMSSKDVRDYINDTIKYLVIDEAQDTNRAQYCLLRIIGGSNNICLIGDQDQSIYGFRDARPDLMNDFIKKSIDIKMFKLEQNYRSTKNIVCASNALIKNNLDRIKKTMFTKNNKGNKIIIKRNSTAQEEAKFIAKEIFNLKKIGVKFKNIAILYRVNRLSRHLEDALMSCGIDYNMIGSTTFYKRKEIKDCLVLLRIKLNQNDKEAMNRLLLTQPGIGKSTVKDIISFAEENNITYVDALNVYQGKPKVTYIILNLYKAITNKGIGLRDYLDNALTQIEYREQLSKENTVKSSTRLENIKEFLDVLKEKDKKKISLSKFLDEVSLMSTRNLKDTDKVTLMTIHSAKGLEFNYVFLCGLEEGILPHSNALKSKYKKRSIEEERRLMYVGMTRAKIMLYLTNAYKRNTDVNDPSRFIKEIPSKYRLHC